MRHFTLLTILVILSAYFADAQTEREDYLIGIWNSIDSSTGLKGTIKFQKNDTVVFQGKDFTKWKYSAQMKDSIIYLKYEIKSKDATFLNEGILVIQNDTCFWWFNPNIYKEYVSAKNKGCNITQSSKINSASYHFRVSDLFAYNV